MNYIVGVAVDVSILFQKKKKLKKYEKKKPSKKKLKTIFHNDVIKQQFSV